MKGSKNWAFYWRLQTAGYQDFVLTLTPKSYSKKLLPAIIMSTQPSKSNKDSTNKSRVTSMSEIEKQQKLQLQPLLLASCFQVTFHHTDRPTKGLNRPPWPSDAVGGGLVRSICRSTIVDGVFKTVMRRECWSLQSSSKPELKHAELRRNRNSVSLQLLNAAASNWALIEPLQTPHWWLVHH